ncbi:hypothetical protein [Bacillus sp. SM2101]
MGNEGENTINVIDTKTHSVISTVSVGSNPVAIAFTRD